MQLSGGCFCILYGCRWHWAQVNLTNNGLFELQKDINTTRCRKSGKKFGEVADVFMSDETDAIFLQNHALHFRSTQPTTNRVE